MMPPAASSVRSASSADRTAISSRRLATSPVMLLVVSRAMIRSIGGSVCTDDVALSSARANSALSACASSCSRWRATAMSASAQNRLGTQRLERGG